MPVGSQDGWTRLRGGGAERPIEIAGDHQAGEALEVDFFDAVAIHFDTAVDGRVHWIQLRPRFQSQVQTQLPPQLIGPLLPRLQRGGNLERKVSVEIDQRGQAVWAGIRKVTMIGSPAEFGRSRPAADKQTDQQAVEDRSATDVAESRKGEAAHGRGSRRRGSRK
jgi:hypothetical protein